MLYQRVLQTTLALLATVVAVLSQQQYPAAEFAARITHKPAFTPQLRGFIETLRKNWTIPGLSVAVIQADDAELEGFGHSTEEDVEVNAHTLFNIASCSKAFLAGSLGILMDDFTNGRNVTPLPVGLEFFDWRTEVKDLLPNDWAMVDEWAHKKATIRDLLTHVSGLPSHDLSYTSSDSPVDVVRRMRHLRPSFGLREKFQYNNQMYVLATHIVSLYSSMSYIEFVTKRIFTPLKMNFTTFSKLEALGTGLLSHAFSAEGRRIPFWFPDSIADLAAGPGGINSNAHDMAKWIRTLLHEGIDHSTNQTILPSSVFRAMTSAYSIVSPAQHSEFSFVAYGLGWNRFSYQGHEILQHSGAIPGFSVQLAVLPNDNIGVIVLCNASQKENQAAAIVYRIVESLLGLPWIASSRLAALQKAQQLHPPKSERHSDDQNSFPLSTLPSHTDSTMAGNGGFSLEKYAGTYTNPGYPNITICSPVRLASESANDKICSETLKNFSFFDDFSKSNTTLYLAIPSIWVRHARLQPAGSHCFNVTSTYLFPEGYGRDKSPFELREMAGFMGDIEFVVGNNGRVVGLGMENSDVREVTDRQKKGGTVRDTAGVWFDKI
ncbi:beta-lactamase/transpeptidase-like protein [Irpex rosettiformis]|uniref:Beta-lactamase/transpeptidase-like protein n=1 Tax=Irpex rosettiformis TaxID=378272 RepID=A0ACB8U0A4_9APHY|nr:beta-lactamase/transpeptidase-like protein [Irpex rosettiformis]